MAHRQGRAVGVLEPLAVLARVGAQVMIYLLVPLGGFLGVLGVYMTLSGA